MKAYGGLGPTTAAAVVNFRRFDCCFLWVVTPFELVSSINVWVWHTLKMEGVCSLEKLVLAYHIILCPNPAGQSVVTVLMSVLLHYTGFRCCAASVVSAL